MSVQVIEACSCGAAIEIGVSGWLESHEARATLLAWRESHHHSEEATQAVGVEENQG